MIFKKVIFLAIILISICFSESKIYQKNKSLLNQSYFEHGMVFITPGGANYTLGYWWRRMGFRYTIGYLPATLFGTQIEARIRLIDKIKIRHSLSMGAGTIVMGGTGFIEDRKSNYQYLAGCYNLRLKRFFAQVGIAGGFGNFSNPQALFQCGFLFRRDPKDIQQKK